MLLKFIFRCLTFYLLTIIVCVRSQDVFNIFSDVKDQVAEKVKEKVQKHIFSTKDDQTCPGTFRTEYRTVLTAYRHLIKDLLEKFPSKDANEYRILLELSSTQFQRLDQFALGSNYEDTNVLHEVHVISDLIKRSVHKIEEDKSTCSGLTWSLWLRSFDINVIGKTILLLLAIGAISFISVRAHLRRGRWFTTIFMVAFIVSFLQNWYTLYQEAQAKIDEVLMKKVPKHCQGHSMGMFDYVKSSFGRFFHLQTNECLEYYKALRATPHAQVTPVQALSMTCAQLFVTPLGTIGESLSQFFAGTMRHVPMVLWPIIISLILIIFIIVIILYSGYDIHLPFMMGSIQRPARAAITTTVNEVEKLENSSNQSNPNILELQNKIKELELQLEQKNLQQIEYKVPSSVHASRSSSLEKNASQRERSLSSTRRVQTEQTSDSELRQRTTSSNIGFRKEFLPS